jgi:hypothetical protein
MKKLNIYVFLGLLLGVPALADPWGKALVGLGGLGADVLSKSGDTNYMNAAIDAYQKAEDDRQEREAQMKVLEDQIGDLDLLLLERFSKQCQEMKRKGTLRKGMTIEQCTKVQMRSVE